jgi:hypothetical protein
MIYTYMFELFALCIYIYITLTLPHINVFGGVNIYTRVIIRVTLSFGLFSSPNPSFSGISKIKKFY